MDDVKGRVHKNQCEQSFHIIGGHNSPLLELNGPGPLHKVLGVPNVIGESLLQVVRMFANSLATS